MIRVICPACQSKLNAKKGLSGKTRKCPKCGAPVLIPETVDPPGPDPDETGASNGPEPAEEPATASAVGLAHVRLPDRLNRQSRYLICDRTSVVATWQNNGQGWMLKTRNGYLSATRSPEKLPAQGTFLLVELSFQPTEAGPRLQGIHCFKLAPHWALTALADGDDPIVHRITAPGSLGREQKIAVRKYLSDNFMREVWHEAQEALEYLSNVGTPTPGMP